MERCPNCDTEVREGAKFCTTCGLRFVNGAAEATTSVTLVESIQLQEAPEETALADHAAAAWPAARAGDDAPVPDGWTWQTSPAPPVAPDVPPPSTPATEARSEEQATATWDAPPMTDATGTAPVEPFTAQSLVAASEAESPDTLDRVDRLFAELRQIIASSVTPRGRDLSGVIAELEIATTPPGAMPAEELAALRETLLTARERPRDLDTVVELSYRIDTLVSLVFAYDRTVAAIERALDVMRGPEAGPPD